VSFKPRQDGETGSWLEGVDLSQPGSRFTDRVALAIVTREGVDYRTADGGDAQEIVARTLRGVPDEEMSALGKRTPVDGSIGRGAAGWIAVLEFARDMVIGGVVAGAAWDGVKLAARQLKDLLARLRQDDVRVMVSRGAAAAIAIQHIIDQGETAILDVEVVTDPLAMAGREPTELSYVGLEPWIVSVVDEKRTYRHIVSVSPTGEVLSAMRFPMGEFEQMFGLLPQRD
jgi:hypothetical protein